MEMWIEALLCFKALNREFSIINVHVCRFHFSIKNRWRLYLVMLPCLLLGKICCFNRTTLKLRWCLGAWDCSPTHFVNCRVKCANRKSNPMSLQSSLTNINCLRTEAGSSGESGGVALGRLLHSPGLGLNPDLGSFWVCMFSIHMQVLPQST